MAQDVTQPAPGSSLRAELLDAARPTFMGEQGDRSSSLVRLLI